MMDFSAMEIHKILPHRYPFLLVDRIERIIPVSTSPVGDSIIAYKAVTYNEPFFQGHFPNHPVMPGVLIVEALSQAAGLLVYNIQKTWNPFMYLTGIDKAKFRHPVLPGCLLKLEVCVKKVKQAKFWLFDAKATIQNSEARKSKWVLVSEAEISTILVNRDE